jgi:hypothetical protein
MGDDRFAERIAALEAIAAGLERRMDDRFTGSDRHFDRRLQDLDDKSIQRYEAMINAASVAKAGAEDALMRVREVADKQDIRQNEWRGTVNDIIGTKIDKSEVLARFDAMTDTFNAQIAGMEARINLDADRLGKMEGMSVGSRNLRDDSRATIAVVVALLSVLISPLLGAMLMHLFK